MTCDFAKHYEAANGKPLTCENCPKEHTRNCEKEVTHGVHRNIAVGNRVHSSVAAANRACRDSN